MRTTGRLANAYREQGKVYAVFALDSDTGLADLRSDELLDIKAEKHINKRSNTANGYMWALITEIAKAVEADPIEIYRECIRRAGVVKIFDGIEPSKVEAAVRLLSEPHDRGTGDFVEVLERGDKCTIAVYFGSSKYNAREFSRLLDEVIDEAKDLGVDIIPKAEIERLKVEYEKYLADRT